MPRPKLKDEKEKLNHSVIIRVNEATFQRLEKLAAESSYRTVAEVARRILANEQLNIFHKDTSLNGPMEELALIRKELKSIGININQQTHHFHNCESPAERAFYVNRTAILYKDVDERLNRLLLVVGKLADKWLQK
ncbi:MAG: mobilization protein [Bacteroidota bacterium]